MGGNKSKFEELTKTLEEEVKKRESFEKKLNELTSAIVYGDEESKTSISKQRREQERTEQEHGTRRKDANRRRKTTEQDRKKIEVLTKTIEETKNIEAHLLQELEDLQNKQEQRRQKPKARPRQVKSEPGPHPRDKDLVWTEEESGRLREDILKPRRNAAGKEVEPHILVFGPSGHGKSTLCNGLRAALKGTEHIQHYYQFGSVDGSYTKNFMIGKVGNTRITDMCGIVQDDAVTKDTLRAILSGQVPLTTNLSKLFKEGLPQESEENHSTVDIPVVIIVLMHKEVQKELKDKLRVVEELAGEGVLTRFLVITHMDTQEPELREPQNLTKLYSYESVATALSDMAEQTGVPESAIYVLRNYVKEQKTDLYTKLHHLRFLHIVMDAIDGQIEKRDLRQNLHVREQNIPETHWSSETFFENI